MVELMPRVIRLDAAVYADIEERAGILAAAQVVLVVALASTIGTGLQIATGDLARSASPAGAIAGSLLAPFIHWLIWSALLSAIGAAVFQGVATFSTMLRMIGFAMAPQVLSIFTFLPIVGPVIALLGLLLSLRAGSIAVQAAHRFDTRRTMLTIAVTFVLAFLISSAVRAFMTHVGLWELLVEPFQR